MWWLSAHLSLRQLLRRGEDQAQDDAIETKRIYSSFLQDYAWS